MTKRVILSLLFFFVLTLSFPLPSALSAKTYDIPQLIREDPFRAACGNYCYVLVDTVYTPAPAGYSPVFLSHLGRHGSRYRLSDGEYKRYVAALEGVRDKLTDDGLLLLNTLVALRNASDGHYGKLTDVGVAEQQGIAERMCRRFPELFIQKGRSVVSLSTDGEPVESQLRFGEVIAAAFPECVISSFSGRQLYGDDSANDLCRGIPMTKEEYMRYDQLRKTKYTLDKNPYSVSMKRLIEKTFKNPSDPAINKLRWFYVPFFNLVAHRCCLSESLDIPYLRDYFTPEEAMCFWWHSNHGFYSSNAWTEENKAWGVYKAVSLLQSIIKDADNAFRYRDVAATLRFSHDVNWLSLVSLMGLEGVDYTGSMAHLNSHHCAFLNNCMSCNVQMVFYNSKKGKTLVKFMINEREVTIPEMTTAIDGVYYKWEDVKKYFQKRIILARSLQKS